jgi:hypothetical protein
MRMRSLAIVTLAAVAARTFTGQEGGPRPIPLAPATAVIKAEFNALTAVRELNDGRILVVDAGGDKKLVVADWRTQAVVPIGREGSGPGEYGQPGALLPVSADSTLVPDPSNGRWLLLAGAAIVQTIPADVLARSGAMAPMAADYAGNVFVTRYVGMPAAGSASSAPHLDSLFLLRIARRTGHADTVGTLRAVPPRVSIQGPSDHPTSTSIRRNPLAVDDEAVVFPDGWIAMARVDPYRVDWIVPGGKQMMGAPLPFARIRLDDREKRAYLERGARNSGRSARSPDAIPDWPDILPPFQRDLLAAPDGRLWIRRIPSAGSTDERYDIVGRRGTLDGRLTVDARTRVIGFGRQAVFSVETDDDGIQHLRRHPLPRF